MSDLDRRVNLRSNQGQWEVKNVKYSPGWAGKILISELVEGWWSLGTFGEDVNDGGVIYGVILYDDDSQKNGVSSGSVLIGESIAFIPFKVFL